MSLWVLLSAQSVRGANYREAGVGTLLFDLLSQEEEAVDISTRHLRFDIGLLTERLVDATNWIKGETDTWHLRVGYLSPETERQSHYFYARLADQFDALLHEIRAVEPLERTPEWTMDVGEPAERFPLGL